MANLTAPDGRAVDAVVFDLDGTLLNTLPDLVALTNAVLDACGYPQRTADEVLSFVGSGVKALIRLAVPSDASDADVERASSLWQEMYPDYGHKLTRPYDGIPEMLAQLKSTGVALGVLSNKFDAGVRDVIGSFLPGVFDIAHGESPEYPRKPDPTGLLRMLGELGTTPQRCVFVGDSFNDVNVARSSGAYSVAVSWGYTDLPTLKTLGAASIINAPGELLDVLGCAR